MKFNYVKPELNVESIQLSQSIAADAGLSGWLESAGLEADTGITHFYVSAS